MSTRSARLGTAAIFVVALAALLAPAAWGQAAPSVKVDPNTAPAGSKVKLTLTGFAFLADCNVQAPTRQTCIYVDFVQGSRVTTIATATGSNPDTPSEVPVPPACASAAGTNCSDPGAATIRATSPNGQGATTKFTVLGPGTTTKPTTSTSSTSSTSTTSTSTSTTTTTITSSTTTESTSVFPTTTVPPLQTKKTKSHSDVPRYFAVALVVAAAAATAAVDTRMRRLRG